MKYSLAFVSELSNNNNREWFLANKHRYEDVRERMIAFADRLLEEMNQHDVIETTSGKKSLNRIYRDVRFSKDKTPYKSHWGGGLRRLGTERRGGYYYHIDPKGSFVMGGFFGPNPPDLLHIRKQISQFPDPLLDIMSAESFKSFFGTLQGNQLKTAPKGFAKDDPAIDILRHKQFIIRHDFKQGEVLHKDFHVTMSNAFKQMRPFFDYMTDILTTDLNGVSIN